MSKPDDLTVHPETSLEDVMAAIDEGAKGIALVVEDGRFVDTVTDGDIRRGILSGLDLDNPIEDLLASDEVKPRGEPVTASVGDSSQRLRRLMDEHGVRQIPVVDEDDALVDLVTREDLLDRDRLPVEAVVMAGGFGTRLRPLTEDTPKPMLDVDGRPLLERLVLQLRAAGIHEIRITTHYREGDIIDHFGDGEDYGVDISYVREEDPLGTAGALGLIDDVDRPLVVMNGDILTQLDFRTMWSFHDEHDADMTVAVRDHEVEVPYGVLRRDGVDVTSIEEKPVHRHFVNAGVYVLEPDVVETIPEGEKTEMPDVIREQIKGKRRVVSFPILEYWKDIGQPDDYERARRDAQRRDLNDDLE